MASVIATLDGRILYWGTSAEDCEEWLSNPDNIADISLADCPSVYTMREYTNKFRRGNKEVDELRKLRAIRRQIEADKK